MKLALAAILMLCGAAAHDAAVPDLHPNVTGTYILEICRDGCDSHDSTRAYLRGTLVLLNSSFKALESFLAMQGRANACFDLHVTHPQHDSYAAIDPAGATLWAYTDSGAVALSLFRSPDAGYEAVLRPSGSDLIGSGGSWGAGAAEIAAPRDSLVAHRTGPADAGICQRWNR